MSNTDNPDKKQRHQETRILHVGRDTTKQFGFVNPPIVRGSTVVYPDYDSLTSREVDYTYGRQGTPTTRSLETVIADIEGGYRTVLPPSGLAALACALSAFLKSGDHILVTDSVYRPTRRFCDEVLLRMNIETTYYDPSLGSDIASLVKSNTRLIFLEAPGSQTFEMQDIPAIVSVARDKDIWTVMDNTWASPLYFKPFEFDIDVSVQAATKYIIGHSDAMLGSITANERAFELIEQNFVNFGLCPGPEDAYLGLRGIRTMPVRLKRHWESGVKIARWLRERPEIARVLHPALETDPGYALWERDFLGASGLFSIIMNGGSEAATRAFLDRLELFAMGYSWGGFESLAIPFDPTSYRTAVPWSAEGTAFRLHVGLDEPDDLIADLESALYAWKHAA